MSRDEFWFWFGCWTSILMLAGAGTVINFSDWFEPRLALKIAKACMALAAINNVILTAAKYRGYMNAKIAAALPDPQTVAKVLIAAFIISVFLAGGMGMAQTPRPKPQQIVDPFQDIKNKIEIAKQAASNDKTNDPDLSCDFRVFLGLTPSNLEKTIKKCLSDADGTLVDDTARALDSAQNFKPNPDQDAINCLTPGLALLRAGVQVPAVPAQDAVPATATAPAILAIAAQPAKNPGVILLFQKYREFVLAGALTSCKTWVDTPVNATVAQGLSNAAGVAAATAVLAPK